MKTLLYSLLILTASHISAQITDVRYMISYDYDQFHYDMNVIVEGGVTPTPIDALQSDMSISIVTADFADLEVISSYAPIATMSGSPVGWSITEEESSIGGEFIIHKVGASDALLAVYENVEVGDTIKLFSFLTGGDCYITRLWENDLDANLLPPGSLNFNNVFALESSTANLYMGNVASMLPSPPNYFVMGDNELCVGETRELSPSSGGTWVSTNPSIAVVSQDGIVTAITPGVAQFFYIANDTGCESQPPLSITVLGSEPITIQDDSLCIGEATQAFPSSGGVWTSSDPVIATINNSGGITALGPGTCTVQFTNVATGCTSEPSEEITVFPTPTTAVAGPTEICVGDVTQLIPSSGGTWVSANQAVATVTNSGLVTGVGAGTTTFVFVESATGCSSEPTVQITVADQTTGVGQYVRCLNGGSTYLQASEPMGTWTVVSFPTTPPTLSDIESPVVLVSGFAAPGAYTFAYTDGVGCEEVFTVTVGDDCACPLTNNLVRPLGTESICFPDTVTLVTMADTFPGEDFYWEVDVNGPTMPNPSIVGDIRVLKMSLASLLNPLDQYSGGSVWVRVIQEHTCLDTSNVVQLDFSPNMQQEILAPSAVCAGEDVELLIEILPDDCSVVWEGPNGFTGTGQFVTISNFAPTSAGIYKATITCGDCTEEISSQPINILQASLSIFVEELELCVGQQTVASFDNGLTGVFTSTDPAVATVDSNTGVITGISDGTVQIAGIPQGFDCPVFSEPITVGSFPVNIGGPTELCVNGVTFLTPSSGGVWFSNNTAVATVTNSGVVTAISPGCVNFTFTSNADGCTGTTEPLCTTECDDPCDPSNTETNTFSGTVYADSNDNGMLDAGETPLPNVLMTIPGTNFVYVTSSDGTYSLTVPVGTYTIKAEINQGSWEEDQLELVNVSSSSPCLDGLNFGFVAVPGPPNFNLTLVSQHTRCEEEVWFYIHYQNIGSEPFTGEVCVTFDPVTQFTGFLNSNGTLDGNQVCWYVEDVEPFTSNSYQFQLTMPEVQDPILLMEFVGQVIDLEQNVVATDEYIAELRCSFDPNDKAVKPARAGNSFKTLIDEEELEYHIRFQNNGNDTAYLVTIEDELDDYLDPRTLRVVGASHEMYTTITGRMVTFTFEDIDLVDSMTNYPASQGYVTFRIKTLPGLAHGTSITNKADIIFDSNPAIITNQVANLMVKDLCLSPKVSTETKVICEGDSYLGYSTPGTYTIEETTMYDCDSLHMLTLEVQSAQTVELPVADLCQGGTVTIGDVVYDAPGTYYDTVYTAEGCLETISIQEVVVQPGLVTSEDVTICQGEMYAGYSESGLYEISGSSVDGCDSTHMLTLTVESVQVVDVAGELCPGTILSIGGQQYDMAGSYMDTSFTSNGCIDKILQIELVALTPITVDIDTTICEGQTFMGLSVTDQYTFEIAGESGCDSIITIDLTVLPLDDPACLSSSLDEEYFKLTITPNPARDMFVISAAETIENFTLLSITTGNVSSLKGVYADGQLTVHTTDLPAGIYIVAVQVDGQMLYQRLVIL